MQSTATGMFPAGVEFARPGRRLGAALLDGLLILVLFGIGWVIWFIVVCPKGQTPGKKLLGLRIVSDADGKALKGLNTVLREFILKPIIVSVTFGIAYLWILFDKERQALYDKITNWNVVSDPTGLTLADAPAAMAAPAMAPAPTPAAPPLQEPATDAPADAPAEADGTSGTSF